MGGNWVSESLRELLGGPLRGRRQGVSRYVCIHTAAGKGRRQYPASNLRGFTMKRAGIALALAFFAAGPAFAADDGDMITRLMGKAPGPKKVYVCFSRVYNAEQLAAHPDQKATSMKLLVRMENDKETRQPTFRFTMGLIKRASKTLLTTSGDCGQVRDGKEEGPVTRLGCGVECDGGGLGIAMGEDNHSISVSISRIRVSPKGVSAEEGGGDFTGDGDDDLVFQLDRTAAADCASILDDKKEAAALRRMK
jgi:hypothetical protein